MTRKHYDSKKLTRYQRRKIVRESRPYRFRPWLRRNRVLQRLDTVSTHVRYLSLSTLFVYFTIAISTGPGSGLLPAAWDGPVCWAGGIAFTIAQAWITGSEIWKDERAKLARIERLQTYKKAVRQRELK